MFLFLNKLNLILNNIISNGRIGIIPYIYEDAKRYYYNLYLAQKRNEEVQGYTLEVKEIVIASPRMISAPPKLFDLGGED